MLNTSIIAPSSFAAMDVDLDTWSDANSSLDEDFLDASSLCGDTEAVDTAYEVSPCKRSCQGHTDGQHRSALLRKSPFG